MRIYVRTAKPSDRDAIFKFTEHTWEWGDYIPDVWDRWLAESDSRLLVAALNRVPVGICHVVMVSATEAWIEGLRVDPSYRRQGIARHLTRRCVDEAKVLGADVARFITSSQNTPVHAIAKSLGFKRIITIQPMSSEAKPEQIASVIRPDKEDLQYIVAFVYNSSSFKASAGLYGNGWRFLRLTPDEIEKKLNEGMIRIIGRTPDIQAAAIVDIMRFRESLGISYAGGEETALTELATAIRSEAVNSGLKLVNTRLPDSLEIERPFVAAGYSRENTESYWIFEKHLRQLDLTPC